MITLGLLATFGRADADTIPVLLPKDTIKQVIQRHWPEVRQCFEDGLKTSPKLEGKVVMNFVIGATGDVSEVLVKESTLHDEKVETCMAHAMRTWKFPEPLGGGRVVVTYPYVFKSV